MVAGPRQQLSFMKIVFLGDIFGRSGRDAVAEHMSYLKKQYQPDFVIVNGENAAHGFGLLPAMAQDFFKLGIDIITGGNHTFDKSEIISTLSQTDRVLSPLNLSKNVPGKGYGLYTLNGKTLLVINVMGRLFMENFLDCPFRAIEDVLKQYPLGGAISAIFVDVHTETTAEKMAIARYFDGKVSAVVGTHTHVPTADAQILKSGTAYLTDAGMCGDYDSVIGLNLDTALVSFLKKIPRPKQKEPANGEGTVCGVFIDIAENGKATKIQPIRLGPILENVG